MAIKSLLFVPLLFASSHLGALDDRYYRDFQPKDQFKRFAVEMVEGGVKGDFVKEPTIGNVFGNIAVNLTPVYFIAAARDFAANFKKSWESGFDDYKFDTALSAIGVIPVAGEIKNIKNLKTAFKAGKELRLVQKVGRFAPALESGLTRKLQASIVHSLDDDMIIGVRSRPYLANFMDGKLPAKPSGVQVDFAYKNGVRVLQDGRRVVSDLDIAFVARNGRALPESKVLKIGETINTTYGHAVVQHGDNYNGVKKGVAQAIEVEQKNEKIFLFTHQGFLSSHFYKDMIEKYAGRQ